MARSLPLRHTARGSDVVLNKVPLQFESQQE